MGAYPDLFRGVPADEHPDRRGEAAAVTAGQLRAAEAGRHRVAEPAGDGRGEVGQRHDPRLPGGRGAQQAVTEPGSADHHGPQVRLAAERRAWRGDQQQRVRGEVRDDAGELLVRGGGRGPFWKTERAKIDYGQRTAGQHRSGELAGSREVLSDVAGRRGDRERGAGPDGRDAAGQAAEQPPVGALVELLVVADDLRHRGDAGAGPLAEHRGQRRAGARAFRAGAAVEGQPAVVRAGHRLLRVIDERADRAALRQPPQRGGRGRGGECPAQAGYADDDDVPDGARVRQRGGRAGGEQHQAERRAQRGAGGRHARRSQRLLHPDNGIRRASRRGLSRRRCSGSRCVPGGRRNSPWRSGSSRGWPLVAGAVGVAAGLGVAAALGCAPTVRSAGGLAG